MPRPRVHDENLRQRLLETASAAIAAEGEQSLSLRGLAAEAGTTTTAVYSLFGDREALIAAVAEEGFRRFAQTLDAVPQTEDPWADLLALGVAYREYALAEPHFYKVMFGGPRSGRADGSTGTATFEVLSQAVRRATGSETGVAQAEATRLWALTHGLVSLELSGLLPCEPAERERAYLEALRASV